METQETLFEMEPIPVPKKKKQIEIYAVDRSYSKRANDLIDLLIAHVEVCDVMEDHNGKVIGKRYRNLKEETAAYRHLQEEYVLPLISKCAWARIEYAELMEIIPQAFKTDYIQRCELLEDLVTWSVKEFGEHVIPF